jgi:8-oxo-dGTP diphosphatase
MPSKQPPARVGVGVGVLVLHEGLVLLGKRLGSHGAGTWSAPGGRLEFGEQIEACAARELKEETGLAAGSFELGPYTNDLFEEVQEQYVTIFVVARGIRGSPVNLEPGKCEGWAWGQCSGLHRAGAAGFAMGRRARPAPPGASPSLGARDGVRRAASRASWKRCRTATTTSKRRHVQVWTCPHVDTTAFGRA